MTGRERVETVIKHGVPDRIPIYAWLSANLEGPISQAYGSLASLEDRYEFDFAHLFGGPSPRDSGAIEEVRKHKGAPLEPADLLDIDMADPDDDTAYDSLRAGLAHHKDQRGRFVYVQTPGLFEANNGYFGIENHLMYLALYKDDLKEVYRRQAEWNRKFSLNCLDLGIDMIHVSDDWGSQHGLLFSPETWWELMYPYHKTTADAVKRHGGYLSLHSDGNVLSVVDGIVDIGFDVVHPWQESAGMDLAFFDKRYRGKFVVMGGLDVQTTIGFGKTDKLTSDIERVMAMFRSGGLLYCTTHFVQNHCSMEELAVALDTMYACARSGALNTQ